MKKLVDIYPRASFVSQPGGEVKVYRHPINLCAVLGQAQKIIIRPIGYAKSANAKVTLRAFQTSASHGLPEETGSSITLPAGAAFTDLRPPTFTIDPPFEGRLEIVLEVEHTSAAGEVYFDLQVAATLIIEE